MWLGLQLRVSFPTYDDSLNCFWSQYEQGSTTTPQTYWFFHFHVLGSFSDFPKAFDFMHHDILLPQFELYGIRDLPHKWLTFASEKF